MPLLRPKKPLRVSTNSSDSGEPILEALSLSSPKPAPSPSKLGLSSTTKPLPPILANNSDRTPKVPIDTPRLVISDANCDNATDVVGGHAVGLEAAMSEALDTDQAHELARERAMAHRDSIAHRVAELLPHPSQAETRKKKKGRRSRRASTSSAISQGGNSIAAALAKSGLQINGPPDQVGSVQRAVSTGRSPYLLSTQDYDSDDGYGSEDDSENLSEDDGIDHLPVTGFAVASNRRNAEFHGLFPTVDEGDYLIEGRSTISSSALTTDYGCALAKDILVHGRLYVSENHICFHSNLFGWITDVVIPFGEVQTIEKKMTALVIPNAIGVTTNKDKYTFASLISRDSTYDVLVNIWRIAHPGAEMPNLVPNGASRPASVMEGSPPAPIATHSSTECVCGKEGQHYSESVLDTVFPSSPDKVYNLMFNSGWYRSFLSDNQKLRDIESSDWCPDETGKLTRSTSYIKPLNGSIGPKQTKCHIVDMQDYCDFDEYISMITTTRTPYVPSGGVFSVKTRTCLTWAGPGSTRVVVTTEVEWTGKSWVKGVIERSALDGQKQYHDDLANGMREYMNEHPTEFAVAGAEDVEQLEDEAAQAIPAPIPTEAQEFAAKNRRARQDADYWQLQGALDSVLQGFTSIFSGIRTAYNTTSDLLSDSPISKASFMAALIALLVVSNVYTYVARPESKHKEKRLLRFGFENDVAEAVKYVLDRRAAATPKDEISQLLQLLDEVDARSAALRQALQVAEEGSPVELVNQAEDLD
ncbi:hypothetical protein CspHIS471_0103570 [Cutaneotrichosporon sp. HIS471]|nr:hypothetical protein CspHIS471_0103570 [Cutaneotrichosporon sp. HIS471]